MSTENTNNQQFQPSLSTRAAIFDPHGDDVIAGVPSGPAPVDSVGLMWTWWDIRPLLALMVGQCAQCCSSAVELD